MADITLIMQFLQQQLQKANLIIPDVLTSRDSALRKLDLILEGPIPGGVEEKNAGSNNDEIDEDKNEIKCLNNVSIHRNNFNRRVNNTFVSNNRRSWNAIRQEIVLSFKNFLNQRLNVEEDEITSNIIKLCSANSCKEMIEAGRLLVDNIFDHDKVIHFVNNVTDYWPIIEQNMSNIDTPDKGTIYSLKLRTLAAKTDRIIQQLCVALLITCPHSMTTERFISHYNQIKTDNKSNILEETINNRLYVSLNGVGTENYDPRPAVIEFLKKKERRYREPDIDVYKDRL